MQLGVIMAPSSSSSAPASYTDMIMQFLPLVLIFIVFYFLLIRPQQKKAREHRLAISNIRRGDVVVTGGGLIGKVTKIQDDEASVEIAAGVVVKVLKSTISDVRTKTAPVNATEKPVAIEKSITAEKPTNDNNTNNE